MKKIFDCTKKLQKFTVTKKMEDVDFTRMHCEYQLRKAAKRWKGKADVLKFQHKSEKKQLCLSVRQKTLSCLLNFRFPTAIHSGEIDMRHLFYRDKFLSHLIH